MTEKFPSTGLNGVYPAIFSHIELRQILSAYSEGVLSKNWKDYAIDSGQKQTVFCVVERIKGGEMSIIRSISKGKSNKSEKLKIIR